MLPTPLIHVNAQKACFFETPVEEQDKCQFVKREYCNGTLRLPHQEKAITLSSPAQVFSQELIAVQCCDCRSGFTWSERVQ